MIYLLLTALTLTIALAEAPLGGEYKAYRISPSLTMLQGEGGNITVSVGPDGVMLVDDDFASQAAKLRSKLKELGGGEPRFIVNTHFHYDHTGGNEVFGAAATIIAANAVRERLLHEQTLWHKVHPPVALQALPVLTFDALLTLHFNHDEIKILHLPSGHTDGDTTVFFQKENVASLGDLYFSEMYPIFHPEHSGSLGGLVRNIKRVLKEMPTGTKIVPGHGPLSDRAGLEEYLKMIVDSIATVRAGMKRGLDLKAIQRKGLDRRWEPYGHGYRNTDQWIESIYQSILKPPQKI